MSKKLRGSYYVDGRRSLTLTTSDDDKLVDIGFRLTHDNVDQVCRGGSGNYDPQFARGAGRYGNGPDFRGVFLGFRLVWDRT